MKWINIILTTCFIFLGYSQTDEPKSKQAQTSKQVSLPNTYYLATTFQGKGNGLMFGHAPKGIEIGLEFYIGNEISTIIEEENYTYEQIDNTLTETSNNQSDTNYDYNIDFHATLYVNKKIFNKKSNNNNYAFYTGLKYYKKDRSYKYSYLYKSRDTKTLEVIDLTDEISILLGAKIEYRILKHVSFEFDYYITIGYSIKQSTYKDWLYIEDILTTYSQSINKGYQIKTDLDSPRIIIKYFF